MAVVLAMAMAMASVGGYEMKASGVVRVRVGGGGTVAVTDYGAKGDGKANDTAAVQAAYDACASKGGCQLVFPGGGRKYVLSAFDISGSHIHTVIEEGATVLISNDRSKWPKGRDFIGAKSQTDLAFSGGGVVDGQGLVWWEHRDDFRPRMMYLHGCKNVLIHNLTFKDSPNHFLEMMTDNAEISYTTILAPDSHAKVPSHNTDAVDVHGDPFYIHDCHFDVGDDNVAMHANNTLVERCYFGHGHGASIGSLCDDYITNVTVRDVTFNGTVAGVRIKTHPKCTGYVKNTTYSDLVMHNVGSTIDIDMFYPSPGSHKHTTMSIHDIVIRNVTSYNADSPGGFKCDKESPCRHLTLDHVQHHNTKGEFNCTNAFGTAKDVTPTSCLSPDAF
eukprot:Hpha_TRINITY_DN16170_c0_g7::TRINITY_DN16170_c0_g7_i1::g.8691::m.8691